MRSRAGVDPGYFNGEGMATGICLSLKLFNVVIKNKLLKQLLLFGLKEWGWLATQSTPSPSPLYPPLLMISLTSSKESRSKSTCSLSVLANHCRENSQKSQKRESNRYLPLSRATNRQNQHRKQG